jgi:hypothetical protein
MLSEVPQRYVCNNCAATKASFWVIERFENGRSLGYWNGDSSRDFVTDIELAIQFRRRDDAWRIKRGWHWTDTQATEHSYLNHESDPRWRVKSVNPK